MTNVRDKEKFLEEESVDFQNVGIQFNNKSSNCITIYDLLSSLLLVDICVFGRFGLSSS